MKKMIFILGYLLTLTFIIGAFFKFAHWPSANVLMLTGVTGLALLYLPLLLSSKKNLKTGSVIKWTTIASLYALLFWWDLLMWSGAGEMIALGTIGLAFGFLPYFFFRQYRRSLQSV